MKPESLIALLAGLALPPAFALACVALTGLDPVSAVGAGCASAALASLRPPGGGMVVEDVWRVRFGRREWTFDGDRSGAEQLAGAFLLPFVTLAGFLLPLPPFAILWRRIPGPAELPAVVAVVALLVVSLLRHRREAPLRRWRQELEAGRAAMAPGETARRVRFLASLARPDGAIGHTGGIGAARPGLHEHLEAEAILRAAIALGFDEATSLHARALEYLRSQQLPGGGFPVYPGGAPRLVATARAALALGDGLTAAELEAHRAFVRSCRRSDGGYGRTPRAPDGDEERLWAGRLLDGKPGDRAPGTPTPRERVG